MAKDQQKPKDSSERADRRAVQKRARRSWRLRQREKRAAARAKATPQREPEPAQRAERKRRVRRGVVTGSKSDKTITVRIDKPQPHRIYKKVVRSSVTLHAHDEQNEASEGDTVRVVESRPKSKSKRWRLVEVVERAR